MSKCTFKNCERCAAESKAIELDRANRVSSDIVSNMARKVAEEINSAIEEMMRAYFPSLKGVDPSRGKFEELVSHNTKIPTVIRFVYDAKPIFEVTHGWSDDGMAYQVSARAIAPKPDGTKALKPSTIAECKCEECLEDKEEIRPRYNVCPDCERGMCPRRFDHRNDCTSSDESGQWGSFTRKRHFNGKKRWKAAIRLNG